eukprot:CAMPEP_0194361148 /NCGR_PEP_ID=MMETSP0174-20130528/8711_1 /TAXON_ID=216777 /ORGANISM="Proboscia alata, Strain PI-D3" /LENGTH=55 /DNA_ID=CAMNT_0039133195 /DNA_START=9 /DNA_END=176 /DNA_ORIENTATION=+
MSRKKISSTAAGYENLYMGKGERTGLRQANKAIIVEVESHDASPTTRKSFCISNM